MANRWQLTVVAMCMLLVASSSVHANTYCRHASKLISIWFGAQLRHAQSQRNAVAAIREFGGLVRYDYQFPTGLPGNFDINAESRIPRFLLKDLGVDFFHNVVSVQLKRHPNFTDEALQYLPCFPRLCKLYLHYTQVTDDSLKYVGKMKRLEKLHMHEVTEVSDEGVHHLRNLSRLRSLHIFASRISDKSLEVFGTMTRLEVLYHHGSQLSDAGLTHLVGLNRLEGLALSGPRRGSNMITDDGISQLHGLKKLKVLWVERTQVTREGAAAFERAVPGCDVSWSRE